jgi:cyclopropane fatty-acyl-phospholipid synthase-like methyltransferase
MLKSRVLDRPSVFDLYQRLVGAPRSKRIFVSEHVRARGGERVIDLGCGTGELLSFLPEGVSYLGVDIDRGYIETARKKFGDRGEFVCADLTTYRPAQESYDLAIGYGVLHHLDDRRCRAAVGVAHAGLTAAGRAIFAEPCRTPSEGFIERALMDHDRGRHIRTAEGYADLLREQFGSVTTELLPDTYRLPLTLVVLEAKRG